MSDLSSAVELLPLRALQDAVSYCLLKDQFRLRRLCRDLQAKPDLKKQQLLQADILASQSIRQKRAEAMPRITYPGELPVVGRKDDIKAAIAAHQVVIIAGETGSGKTTQIPKICLELGRGVAGLVGHTQPRRLAARSVGQRLADELSVPLGQQVGYKVRFGDHTGANTLVKLMTDGILLAEIQQDKFLNQYDTIIIDEAHERSLNIDFLLGYFKQILPKRPDLKLIITSATIDPERFSRHFSNAPMLEVSGRTYPVEVRYRPASENEDKDADQLQAIFDAVEELYREPPGDILIFLNGEREIRDTADALEKLKLPHTEILPLYARLSAAEQNRIFQSHPGRRIVLSTNVAETSLTVPGIRYVIDPGTARISRYSYRSKVQQLPIEAISQASANQRKGRCGRVAAGICIRLYSEDDFNNRDAFTDPEILRTNLASVILQMLALGLGDIQQFPFLQKPDSRFINDGVRLLDELGALKTERKAGLQLTPLGRQLSRLPIDPRLARMVLAAAERNALDELLVITAALSIQDPRERPLDKKQKADELHGRFADPDSDFASWLKLWRYLQEQQESQSNNQFRRLCKQELLNYLRVREWQDLYAQLSQVAEELGLVKNTTAADYQSVHTAILTGLLGQIGSKDSEADYLGARQSRFYVFPGSHLFKRKPKWVMTAELVETSKLYARTVAKIEPEWVEPLAQHLVSRSYSEPHWEKKRGAVIAFEQVTLYGLIIVGKRAVQYSKIEPELCHKIFIREALVNQELGSNEPFLAHNARLIDAVTDLEDKSRRRDILVDEETLVAFYAEKVPLHANNRIDFQTWWKKQKQQDASYLNFDPDMLKRHEAGHITDDSYPEFWRQGNLRLPLEYHFSPGAPDDGVSLCIPLALLNQVEEQGFDWLIPGLRHELLVSLIKCLPKVYRRNFVPAPNYADALLQSIQPDDGPLLSVVTQRLKRMSGVTIPDDAWELTELPAHLKMNFKVTDDKGAVIAQHRSLALLKQKLQGQVQETLSQVAEKGIEQQELTDWSFGELPREYIRIQSGYEIKAFPALVDQKNSVSIQLLDSPEQAAAQSRLGLRRLMLLNLPSPVKYLQDHLPNKAKLGLYFNPFGKVLELIDDCIAAGIDHLISQQSWPHNQLEFLQLRDSVRAELGDTVLAVALQVEQILTVGHEISKKLRGRMDLALTYANADIKQQLDALLFKGFVSEFGAGRLDDIKRYLLALQKRLEKLPVDPQRDRLQMHEYQKAADAYQQLLGKFAGKVLPEPVREIRWMLEELKVSLFAQQLGTPYPISAKRVLLAVQELK
ncbi:ATP-dependent RNA helicase HrpA [Rheinheimera texasensis]|uniref:ATP-dependent RNA helicase HrpA n=1 Tax=Rheinheimera texasensis TaxID=306205 RepID=UPI000AAA9C6F|nr:ATP-dependent RNA helicase HrpA [Rheinheimera texasensis]